MSDRLSRRDFLFYGGATALGVTLGELGRRHLARADERAGTWRERGLETWAASVCRECPAACGVRARLIDGVPVKLEGNPLCPVSRGRLCPKGQAGIEAYFDPDRLLGPARRVGKRGEGRWERISWEAAVESLASHVRDAASDAEPGLAVGAEERGPLAGAWERFWRAAGTRVAWTSPATASRLAARLGALTGASGAPLFDLEHASYVLSFAAPIVEDWLSPVWSQRSFGRFRRGTAHARGRLVQVDCRRSLTARKADEWLPVPAESQPALAWGIAAVLLREGRTSRPFLDELGGNAASFAKDLVARYSSDEVAAATGVPVVTILRLARELAGSPQPLVAVAADADASLFDAVFALNGLLGAYDRPGGISVTPSAGASQDEAGTALGELFQGRAHPRLLAFRDASALRSFSSPVEPAVAFGNVPFIVSFSPYLDEAASIADLLLPAPTSLEGWHALAPPPAAPGEALALARPAVSPRHDTRDTAEVLKAVADAAGGALAAACPWRSSEELVRAEIERVWKERRGAPYRNPHETGWVQQLEKGGWWVPPAASAEEFQTVVLDAGGWADPFVAPAPIREALRAQAGLTFAVPEGLAASRAPSAGGDGSRHADYPLSATHFTPAVVNLMGSPNQPVLFELLGQPEGAPWQVWAEMAPETARSLSVDPGARIRIESPRGSIEAVAVHAEGMPRDTLAVAFVPTVRTGGRWARLLRADARRLWGDAALGGSCAVRVRSA